MELRRTVNPVPLGTWFDSTQLHQYKGKVMIQVEWLITKLTHTKFDNTYELVAALKGAGVTNLPSSGEYKDTHWMKMFNKLNAGITIYMVHNPFESEIHNNLEIMWSSSKEHLESTYYRVSEDI